MQGFRWSLSPQGTREGGDLVHQGGGGVLEQLLCEGFAPVSTEVEGLPHYRVDSGPGKKANCCELLETNNSQNEGT